MSEDARILDGLYDHLLRAIHARLTHERPAHAECPDCQALRQKEAAARKAYDEAVREFIG